MTTGWSKKDDVLRLLFVLFLGQVVSFSMAAASFTSSFISNLGARTPLTQSFSVYLLLAAVYGSIFLYRRQKFSVPWYWYLALAFVDVQGNYLIVKAYQYSSITSVTLLDCWTIPWVIILTWFVLGTRYSPWQFVGAGICIAGLCLVLLSDSEASNVLLGENRRALFGDGLVIAATFCYAFSNVGEEILVKTKDRVEVIMMIGIFGLLVSGVEISVMERENVQAMNWSPTMISLFAGYAAALFVFYSLTPLVLKMSGATLFNLSLLTSDVWAVVIKLFFYHQKLNWLYYLAFACVAIGLIIYSMNEGGSSKDEAQIANGEATHLYEELGNEENSDEADLESRTKNHQAVVVS